MSNLTNIYSKSMELRVTHIIFYRSPRFLFKLLQTHSRTGQYS